MWKLLKTVGKAAWRLIRSEVFREVLIGFLLQKLQEQEAQEGAEAQ
jgi:hypothetical protein